MKKYIFYLIAFLAISCEDVLDKNMCRILEDTEIHKEIVLDELTLGETTIAGSDGEK